jgi:hypothetical protein
MNMNLYFRFKIVKVTAIAPVRLLVVHVAKSHFISYLPRFQISCNMISIDLCEVMRGR